MLTLEKLERTLHIRQTIEKPQEELHSISSSIVGFVSPPPTRRLGKKNRKGVAEGKLELSGVNGDGGPVRNGPPARVSGKGKVSKRKKKKRTMSAGGKARIAAAQKARWAKVKAGKQNSENLSTR